MSSLERAQANVVVENVGGIDHTEVDFSPGVTILAGRNATNRTSLLRAIMAALGSDDVSLKGDADQGRVELTIGGETYTHTLERMDGTVTLGGDPYLDDSTAADLFAFLLETNEARQMVAREEDLRGLIMRPVDTDEIEARIRQLEEEKRELDADLAEIADLNEQLLELKDERARLQDEINAKESELADLEEAIEAHSADPQAQQQEQSEFEAKMEELRDARNELEELCYNIEIQQQSLDALRDDRDRLEADEQDYPESVTDDLETLEDRIEEQRRQKRGLETELTELQSVIQFNEELLDETPAELRAALAADEEDELTDQLVGEDSICWTCGSRVPADQIESTLEQLRELHREKRQRQQDIEADIEELEGEKLTFEEKRRQHEQVQQKLTEVEREIERREQRVEELQKRREKQEARIEELEAEVEALELDEDSELLALHEDANELEFELGRLRMELDDVETEIEDIEERLAEETKLEDRREEVPAELQELRTHIERLETDAVEAFNDHMDSMLELLDYDNLERIWIERYEDEGSRGEAASGAFDLHVVRSTDEEITYEDSVEHLSESEREVTGLVFALAGYLVHELAEELPVLLLDSLEAIDADRIAELVEYFADHAEYLIVALLSEDAAALPDSHGRITDI